MFRDPHSKRATLYSSSNIPFGFGSRDETDYPDSFKDEEIGQRSANDKPDGRLAAIGVKFDSAIAYCAPGGPVFRCGVSRGSVVSWRDSSMPLMGANSGVGLDVVKGTALCRLAKRRAAPLTASEPAPTIWDERHGSQPPESWLSASGLMARTERNIQRSANRPPLTRADLERSLAAMADLTNDAVMGQAWS